VALNDRASHLVHALKYHDRLEAARFMAGLMHRAAKDTLMQSDALIPVPLHWLRLWRRRSNQAALLALTLGRLCGKQPLAQGLIRGRPTPSQVGLNQKERQENMRGAFAVAGAAHMAIAGKRVALIDDVVTTGATAGAAAEALLKAGARQVDVVVFALVLLPGQDHM
jgi:ComF family protein